MNIKGASLKEIEQEYIKKALDRLEKLEKEYEEYKKVTEKVINAFQISNKNLTNENNKFKKVIEILKELRFNIHQTRYNNTGYELSVDKEFIEIEEEVYNLFKKELEQ